MKVFVNESVSKVWYLLFQVVLLSVFWISASLAADAPSAILGQPRDVVEQTEFVKFFHFVRYKEFADPGHPGVTVTTYFTEGRFKGLVTLAIATDDATSKVTTATLLLRRDFVDSPQTATIARDVVKSLVQLSPGDIADSPISSLESEIWQNCVANQSCKPAKPSTGYSTYLGQQEKERINYPGGYVMLQNAKLAGTPTLLVEVRAE